MKINLYSLILLTFILLIAQPMFAGHLAGYEFTYKYLGTASGNDHYRVMLTLYEDCAMGIAGDISRDEPAYFSWFKNGYGALLDLDTTIPATSSTLLTRKPEDCSSVAAIPFCMRKTVFEKEYYLPPLSAGYAVRYQRGGMVATDNVVNSGDLGFSCVCIIRSDTATSINNGIVINTPAQFIFTAGQPIAMDLSATDPDGDELTYEFYPLRTTIDNTNPKPYPGITEKNAEYVSPLIYDYPVHAYDNLRIDLHTGRLTGTPDKPGRYLVALTTHQLHKGIVINSNYRAYAITVAGCTAGLNEPGELSKVSLFPNPAGTEIALQSQTPIRDVTITNTMGQAVLQQSFAALEAHIDISALPAGMYFVQVNRSETMKFVKN